MKLIPTTLKRETIDRKKDRGQDITETVSWTNLPLKKQIHQTVSWTNLPLKKQIHQKVPLQCYH